MGVRLGGEGRDEGCSEFYTKEYGELLVVGIMD